RGPDASDSPGHRLTTDHQVGCDERKADVEAIESVLPEQAPTLLGSPVKGQQRETTSVCGLLSSKEPRRCSPRGVDQGKVFVVDSPTHVRTNIALQHEPGAGEVFGGIIGPRQRGVDAQGKGFDVTREANGKSIVSRLIERASKRGGGKKKTNEAD